MTDEQTRDSEALLAHVRSFLEASRGDASALTIDDDVVETHDLDSLAVVNYMLLLTEWFDRPFPADPDQVERLRTVRRRDRGHGTGRTVVTSSRLDVRGLRVRYPTADRDAVAGIDLEVQSGEVLAVLGRNGAGKSTTFDALVGLVPAAAGEAVLTVDGTSVDLLGPDGRSARRRIGYAFQDEAIYPIQSVRGNLRFFGRLAGLRGAGLDEAIARYAGQLQIEEFLDRVPGRLSGGERRRVHTAVALLDGRPVVVLDEPTAGVDPVTRKAVLETVRLLAREEDRTVLYSTHYLHEAEEIADRVIVVDRGHVIEHGSPSELVERYGRTEIVLRFGARPPKLHLPGLEFEYGDAEIRVSGTDAQSRVGAVMEQLATEGTLDLLQGVEVARASLEAVFHQLVGHNGDEPTELEVVDA